MTKYLLNYLLPSTISFIASLKLMGFKFKSNLIRNELYSNTYMDLNINESTICLKFISNTNYYTINITYKNKSYDSFTLVLTDNSLSELITLIRSIENNIFISSYYELNFTIFMH